ncbi:XRE family transcriptional regulator [Photobacterium leiognathi]|uniref:XRE family transcriptional regulator n=1 Tax=Photobacterium leiognathi TaxID=553611 RepID=UPI00298281E3|nr:XRE family transcriptional regulator [Photobacterium leiognathi]
MSEQTIGKRIKQIREKNGLSQKELSKKLNVTPMAISHWENDISEPKRTNLRVLISLFDISLEWLLFGIEKANVIINTDDCVSIPFYKKVKASAGYGSLSFDEARSYFSVDKGLLKNVPLDNLVCITVTGDSMEPVLADGSVIVVDMNDKYIKDGKVYVLRQEDIIRVKCLSYSSSGVVLKSYNQQYKDENQTFKELSNFEILGRVICSSSLL